MVDVVNPLKTDTILDPACGSGGFLVSSFKHLLRTNTKGFEHTRFTINEIDEEKIHQNLGVIGYSKRHPATINRRTNENIFVHLNVINTK